MEIKGNIADRLRGAMAMAEYRRNVAGILAAEGKHALARAWVNLAECAQARADRLEDDMARAAIAKATNTEGDK